MLLIFSNIPSVVVFVVCDGDDEMLISVHSFTPEKKILKKRSRDENMSKTCTFLSKNQ